jgi:hypothetical protein
MKVSYEYISTKQFHYNSIYMDTVKNEHTENNNKRCT